MPIIRTPDDRFQNLTDFPYAPHYVTIHGLRIHYLDEGQGEPILCLHGEPSWSFLYRRMIPALSARGRVIAPDLVGFGRSDKFSEIEEYTYAMHSSMLSAFVTALDLRSITLVCQDWGGILGLPMAADMPERFARLVIMNTGLPTGERPPTPGFLQWRAFAERMGRDIEPGQLVAVSAANQNAITPAIMAAYDAPFPDASFRAGVAAFPLLVPIRPDDAGAAESRRTRDALRGWDKPALIMFSDSDPVTAGGDRFFRKLIPTAKDQPEIVIQGAGHFLQEEKGEEIAAHIADFLGRT